jgi:hypothetical protein
MMAPSNFKLPGEGGTERWLTCLGLGADEQQLYAALLRQSPQTGHQLAAATGAAAASTHAALTSLVGKGAAVACANRVSVTYAAVSPDELMCSLSGLPEPSQGRNGTIRPTKANLFLNNPDTDDYRRSKE